MRGLVKTTVEWSVVNDEPEKTNVGRRWGISSLLAQAELIDDGTSIHFEWSYAPAIRNSMLDPSRYVQLDMAVFASLRTGTAASLYEICTRYLTNFGGLTNKETWEWWRPRLTGVPDDGTPTEGGYKFFKRDRLMPAINEINELSNITVELHEFRTGRRITHIQFSSKEKSQASLGLESIENDGVVERLCDIGFTEQAAAKLYAANESDVLAATLAYVEMRMKKGGVESPVALFRDALRKGYGVEEGAKALAKAGNDPKKLKKIKRKKAPEGFVTWNENTFDKLIDAAPETLVPHMKITHSMVLNEVEQGGDARYRIDRLIDDSAQTPEQKERLHARADEIFQTLFDTNVIETEDRDDGGKDYFMTVDMPDDFALDQPLSPFLLAALELLDPESDTYALDVISMVEATLEDPKQVLRAQERQARDEAMIRMKEDGLDYDERMDRLQEITYPKPLEDMLQAAFDEYRHDVPWANDYWLSPKSVVRDMVETASDFTGYIARYNIARSEGTLLRYLSDAYRALARTVPQEKRDEQLDDIISWLRVVVRSIDSSLVDEWENAGTDTDASEAAANLAAPGAKQAVVEDRRGLTVLVRNAMFRRVQLMDLDKPDELGALDKDWGYGVHEWEDTLDDYYDEHEYVNIDAKARSGELFILDESKENSEHAWKVRQIIDDSDGDHDWAITGTVDLDATQSSGEVVFFDYSVSN